MTDVEKLPRGVFRQNGRLYIRYADASGKVRRELVPGNNVAKAKLAYGKRKSEVFDGKFFPEKLDNRPVLFEEIAADYLAASRRSPKRDVSHEESRSRTLLELWRDVPLAQLRSGRIERELGNVAVEEEWTPGTFNRYRALLSGMFRLAIKNDKARANPVRDGIKHRQENNARTRHLLAEEESALIAAVREMAPRLEPKILVALHTGMRRSEQFKTDDCPDGGLKWEYVDLKARLITLPRSKSGEPRRIQINSELDGILRKLRNSVGSVYVFPGAPPDRIFPKIVKAAGIENFNWHDLRHTFASRLIMDGVDIRTVQELMGHKTITMTMRYAHLSETHLQDAVERLAKRTKTPKKKQAAVQENTL